MFMIYYTIIELLHINYGNLVKILKFNNLIYFFILNAYEHIQFGKIKKFYLLRCTIYLYHQST